jgi:hypothetical protein
MITNTFRNKINRLIGKTIVQFGPPRSGSTLVYNILRDVFPKKYIEKRHTYRHNDLKVPVVVTYRHPLDCIASSIQRYELTPTDEVIEQQISEFEENGIWDVLAIKDNPNVLMLRYEEFVYDFEVIFNGIEKFFDIKIPLETRNVLTGRYQIEAVETIVEKMGTWAKYDKRTYWHGKHISRYKGVPFYYKEFFQADQIAYLESVYKKFLLELNYI